MYIVLVSFFRAFYRRKTNLSKYKSLEERQNLIMYFIKLLQANQVRMIFDKSIVDESVKRMSLIIFSNNRKDSIIF